MHNQGCICPPGEKGEKGDSGYNGLPVKINESFV